jgi:hypothetical protein
MAVLEREESARLDWERENDLGTARLSKRSENMLQIG